MSLDKCESFFLNLKLSIWDRWKKQDPSRLSAIKNMPVPTNVSTLQVFLGLANYYGDFIPNMNVLRASLNKSLKKRFQMKLEY